MITHVDDDDGSSIVSVGVDAPKHVSVDRKEVRERRIKSVDKVMPAKVTD